MSEPNKVPHYSIGETLWWAEPVRYHKTIAHYTICTGRVISFDSTSVAIACGHHVTFKMPGELMRSLEEAERQQTAANASVHS